MRRLAIATGGLALLLAAPATAATTIGSPNVTAQPDGVAGCEPTCPIALIQDRINDAPVTAPTGVIVRFRFKGEGPVSVVAYRPSERTDAQLRATRVGVSAPATGAGTGTVVEGAARIPVVQGDMVGLSVPSGATVYGVGEPSETTKAWGVGENAAGTIESVNLQRGEFFYQADIEPDADGDGFGDESQDQCKGQAGTQNGCAPPPPPPPPPPPAATPTVAAATLRSASVRVTKTGKVPVALRNGNSVAVTGTLTLKQSTKTAGRASYSLAAGAAKTIHLQLSKSVRRALRRGDFLRLRLTIVTRFGTTTRSATKTLTIRRR